MKTDRLLAITVLLLNRDRISAKELADRFEVSVRTIYRDIDSINLAGIPVISYQGYNGGFGIMENYRINSQVLTLNDMISLLTALRGINDTLGMQDLDGAIEKITSLVPPLPGDKAALFSDQLIIDIMPWGYHKRQKDILRDVHKSIKENSILEFEYRNSKGETAHRTAEPMTLYFKGSAWYLFAYCLLKNDYRMFRLSRISRLSFLDEKFHRRDMSLYEFINPERETQPLMDITLKFSPEVRYMVEDYFEAEQITVIDNGYLIVKASFPEDEWLLSNILSYGESVEVINPPHIRKKIAAIAERIFSIYIPGM